MGTVMVKIPMSTGTQIAKVDDAKFYTKSPQLQMVLDQIKLDTGHHSDRDLELGTLAAWWLGGTVEDKRPPITAKQRMPRS